eukprot:scaffold62127_cov60-Phaeocystis_antarctica.AAC.2
MSCTRSSPRRASRSRSSRGRRVTRPAEVEGTDGCGGGRRGAGGWRCWSSGAGVAMSTEYEVRSSSEGGWARGGALQYRAHDAKSDRVRCAYCRHRVGTEAAAVQEGAVARAAIRNVAGRATRVQRERAVALGHRQRGQVDLVLRVPPDLDGAASSQERRRLPRQARLCDLVC